MITYLLKRNDKIIETLFLNNHLRIRDSMILSLKEKGIEVSLQEVKTIENWNDLVNHINTLK